MKKRWEAGERVARLAGVMSRERFVAALPHAFLVLEAAVVDDDGLDYHTAYAPNFDDDIEHPNGREGGPREIVELVKSSRNPFADRISIGRAPNCDVVISNASVSKLHAHVRDVDGVLHVTDLGSQNGTFVNEQRLQPHVGTPVRIGDRLRFGGLRAELVDAATVYEQVLAARDDA